MRASSGGGVADSSPSPNCSRLSGRVSSVGAGSSGRVSNGGGGVKSSAGRVSRFSAGDASTFLRLEKEGQGDDDDAEAEEEEDEVRRCRLTVSKPVLKAPMVSSLETTI